MSKPWVNIDLGEPWYLIRLYVEEGAPHMDFEIIHITGRGANDELYYRIKDSVSSTDTTNSLDMSEVMAEGSLKWDGCLNLKFNEYMHFCNKEDAIKLTKIIERLYDEGATRIEGWSP